MHKWIVPFLAVAFTGCAAVLCDVSPTKEAAFVKLSQSQGRTATFRYLGAGGWAIRRGSDVVLTAPFYSNPPMVKVLFAKADQKVIDAELVHIAGELPDVQAVVAGHAHYDHLMDLPHILTRLPNTAEMVGGTTVCNTLAPALNGRACTPAYEKGNVRITPIESEHAPHWRFGIKLLCEGSEPVPRDRLPCGGLGYKEGEPTAYLIEFLEGDSKQVALRVYYTDAGANPGKGIPLLRNGETIDVAILAVASFEYVSKQPRSIVGELQAKHLLLGHWENFFWPARNEGCRVPFTDVNKYLGDLNDLGASYTLPDRRTLITVEY